MKRLIALGLALLVAGLAVIARVGVAEAHYGSAGEAAIRALMNIFMTRSVEDIKKPKGTKPEEDKASPKASSQTPPDQAQPQAPVQDQGGWDLNDP